MKKNIRNIRYQERDFKGFDLETIQGRHDAVRLILSTEGYDEKRDKKWPQHLLEAYGKLASSLLLKLEQRGMSKEEETIYNGAAWKAAYLVPALTSYISLLHPRYSSFAPSVGTDPYFRIVLCPWFFDPEMRPVERGTILVHEVMHNVLGHYDDLAHLDPQLANKAGDAIINQQIECSGDMSLPRNYDGSDIWIFPRTIVTKKYPKGMENGDSFLHYYNALEEEKERLQQHMATIRQGDSQSEQQGQQGQNGNSGQGQGGSPGKDGPSGSGGSGTQSDQDGGNSQNGSGTQGDDGQGQDSISETMRHEDGSETPMSRNGAEPCSEVSTDDATGMDRDKVEKAGVLEKEMARAEAVARAMSEAEKQRGNSGTSFNDFVIDSLRPPKVRWESVLRNVISRSFNNIITGRTDYSYRRPNRRYHPNGFIMPSTIGYAPKGLIGCDTSGSMGEDDYREALGEVEGLCRSERSDVLNFVTVDTEITGIQPVKTAKDLVLTGGGGTRMVVFYQYVNKLQKRDKPDYTVLMTDAYIDWDDAIAEMDKDMHNIVLVTSEGGMDYAKPYMGKIVNLTVIPIF